MEESLATSMGHGTLSLGCRLAGFENQVQTVFAELLAGTVCTAHGCSGVATLLKACAGFVTGCKASQSFSYSADSMQGACTRIWFLLCVGLELLGGVDVHHVL